MLFDDLLTHFIFRGDGFCISVRRWRRRFEFVLDDYGLAHATRVIILGASDRLECEAVFSLSSCLSRRVAPG
jgi:hypothetical protein